MKTTFARLAVVGALLAAGTARAQQFETYRPRSTLFIFNYEVSEAVGSFSDKFVSSTSWRGFGFEGRSMVKDRLSVGLGFDYNRFDQTHHLLTQSTPGGGTISGPVYRYADQLAMKGLIHAYFSDGALRPYVGVGLGGIWTYAYAQSADLARADDGFDFIASPEIGLTFSAASGASSIGLNVAVRYNYTTADFHNVNDAQSVGFIVGLFGGY